MSKKLLIVLLCVVILQAQSSPAILLTAKPKDTSVQLDKLTLEFVPSKDADVIITGTKNLPELLKAEMLKQGYDIGEVDITVGTSYEATGEAMAAGAIDIGWLPGGTYALFSDEVDVILTATRAGLSNDSTDPKTWNGDANKTLPTDEQVTFYRSLIYATPSAYGKELAAKVNAGEALTWDDLNKASWARAEDLLFRRLHLPHHVADGKLRRQEAHRPGQRRHPLRLRRSVRAGCRRSGRHHRVLRRRPPRL